VEPDDFALMEGVRADRDGAFDIFVRRYQRRLYRLAWGYLRNHEDALDAVQETMVRVYVARSKYRPRAHPFTWTSRILANHCIDLLRQRRVRQGEGIEPVEEEGPGRRDRAALDAVPGQERRAFLRNIEEAVAKLPESQREVFMLRHFEELSLEEIAAARGCALGTVKSSLHRAAAAVRALLIDAPQKGESTTR
jgi:RNA polymerase sigma-70 factor (ECF subfamily)